MQGIAIESTQDKYNLTFDKAVFDDNMISNMLSFVELEILANKINFDDNISNYANEIKTNIWNKEKQRLGF